MDELKKRWGIQQERSPISLRSGLPLLSGRMSACQSATHFLLLPVSLLGSYPLHSLNAPSCPNHQQLLSSSPAQASDHSGVILVATRWWRQSRYFRLQLGQTDCRRTDVRLSCYHGLLTKPEDIFSVGLHLLMTGQRFKALALNRGPPTYKPRCSCAGLIGFLVEEVIWLLH